MKAEADISQLVKKLREITGLTQERLAAKIGVTFGTVNRWENRRVTPSPLALNRIENMLRELGEKGADLRKTYFGS